ncbi:MAG: hypothetical protein Q8R28_04335, partial [Dehalococcoidia bacterium]|nr:hypothetical protein [Dehalococcoidia bacterium]
WYELTREDLPEYGPDEPKEWAAWARKSAVQIDDWRKHYGKRTDADKFEADDEYVLLRYSLNRVGRMTGEWICDRTDSERNGPGVLLAKVWPGEEAERVLFRGIPHVVLMSATLRPRSLELLGIPPADFHFAEFPHPFPWSIRPVYWVPTIRALQRTATEDHWRFWSTRIDQLIDRGTAGRGMVHCVSYDRCRMFLGQSRHRGERGLLWTHTSRNLPKVLEDFKTAAPPVVLVSPSIISGFDLPQVSYQVIGKVPFVAGDKLHKAREATDPTWQWYGLGQTIVQQAGRIARSGDGPAKPTFIIDDSISWVMPKCRGLIPEWFRIEKTERIPDWGGAE